MTLADRIINALNDFVALDREALVKLLETRVPCNHALAGHPAVQVFKIAPGDPPTVGLLGILNGIAGVDFDGWGFIAASFDDDGHLVKFLRTPPRKKA
jgi:hypothetical protein